jgi:hypothetical protein
VGAVSSLHILTVLVDIGSLLPRFTDMHEGLRLSPVYSAPDVPVISPCGVGGAYNRGCNGRMYFGYHFEFVHSPRGLLGCKRAGYLPPNAPILGNIRI